MRSDAILGLNSRNHLYTSVYNTKKYKKIANSKLETKRALRKADLRVPKTYKVLRNQEELDNIVLQDLPETGFVVKPNNGLGGEGIMVIEKPGVYAGEWINSEGDIVREDDIRLHVSDILQGRYSMNDLPDTAYVEELVRVHPDFKKYAYHGTPDIRVIVFNKVPVMAMLRLPTEESGGRANLFQGAVAAGIDISSGVTTHAIHHTHSINFLPGTRRKLRHIQIPQWGQILELAVKCQEVVKLGYLGVDIVLQPKSKDETIPMVLELNAQPGLKIQLANRAGLWERLRRVEKLKVTSVKQGIRIGRALFVDPVVLEKGLGRKTIKTVEEIELVAIGGGKVPIMAKIDTGADSSSIDRELAKELGLLSPANHLYEDYFRSALGRKKRQVVQGTYYLAGKKIKSRFSISKRDKLKYKILIGKRDLDGFMILP